MLDNFPDILDSRETNPAFFATLKALTKKDQSLFQIYNSTVKRFFKNILDAGLKAASENPEFKGIISNIASLHTDKDQTYEIIKFRIKTEGKGNSKSPRMNAALILTRNKIIPLLVYTHGERKDTPSIKELQKLVLPVLKHIF